LPEPRRDVPPVDEQIARLTRGAVDVVTPAELRGKLERSVRDRRPLVVKVGFDPTAPDLHLGHTVLLRKMRLFQDLGHRVVFVIGDFTGRIGDPTGRSATRPALTNDEIRANAETYRRQCGKILRPDTEVRFNSEWLDALGADGLVRLAARYTVARMLERNDFKTRLQAGQPIAIHEFLYPLAQAYDSVALEADVELGGTDQLFNLNVGRDVMPDYGLERQVLLTTPLLEGTDGVDKMSKSLGNYIGIDEPPREVFGKLMSISDALMWRYYELCTDVSTESLQAMRDLVEDGKLHPMRVKEGLALRIVAEFHGEAQARAALEEFSRMFREREAPGDVAERRFVADGRRVFLPRLLAETGLAPSRTEAERLLKQGAVTVDGRRVEPGTRELEAAPGDQWLVRVGKRRFARVRFDEGAPRTPGSQP
jgi:tyrosyl-tRNA synthetase